MRMNREWWYQRKDELETLARETCSLLVMDDETLNETLFDLLSIEELDRLFYPINKETHPRILEKIYKLNAGFRCPSSSILAHLIKRFPQIRPEQILFMPEFAQARDFAHAFEQGVMVGLRHISPICLWPDVFREKEIMLCVELPPPPCPSPIRLSLPILEAHSISVTGLHVQSNSASQMPVDSKHLLSFLRNLYRELPSLSVFSFEDHDGFLTKTKQGKPNISQMAIRLETIQNHFPQFKFWLEGGPQTLSHARVLLTGVKKIERYKGSIYVFIDKGMEILIRSDLYGSHHEVVNLSSLNEEDRVPVRLIKLKGIPGQGLCYEAFLAPVKEGNILLISNAGTFGPGENFDSPVQGAIPEHYLLARGICPVKI